MTETNISTTKCCTKCSAVKETTEFNKDKTREDGLFPQCRACARAGLKKHYSENTEKYSGWAKENYQAKKDEYKARARKWEKENPERKRELQAAYRAENKEKISFFSKRDWERHGDKRRASKKEYRKANPERGAEHVRARQTRKQRAMPVWADRKAILEIYRECRRISRETGIKHHVDHYYPLKGKLVSGLHNEYNLRVIPAADNQSKGNSHPGD